MMRNKQVTSTTFASAYAQGFLRCAVASHLVSPASPLANAAATIPLMEAADEQSVGLVVLPELGLTGYSIDDLLHQQTLLDEAEAALELLREQTETLMPLVLVGMPVRWQGHLLNCAVVLHRGCILGIVPKTYLPNYREFYEARHFASGAVVEKGATTKILGKVVPIGTDLLFAAQDIENFVLAIEICEDVWVPTPPSSLAALAGATVIANLSASNAIIGKSAERHALCRVQSARCNAAYLYSAAGFGESTTDLAWDGHAMVYEAGTLLAESQRFSTAPGMIITDVDLELLAAERLRNGSLVANRRDLAPKDYRRIGFVLEAPVKDIGLQRRVARFPFVPDDKSQLDELCEEAFQIQSQGLARRLKASGIERVVIGVSGGLDSSHALLVALNAMDLLKLPRANVLAWTLPAFATTNTTKSNAWRLMRTLGVTAGEIDVGPASMQMLRDIGHPAAQGERLYDTTFENVQAGARTSLLFRLANRHNAIVLGTGDLSELALGWATYGVGDHMSHYNVNCSVPKTLIQHLIRWVAARDFYGKEVSEVLRSILSTEISPELVPGDADVPSQKTEDFVGPYALQDFNLFHTVRYGMRPSKLAFLAWHAWRDIKTGNWPSDFADSDRREYDLEAIRSWLRVFIKRFFETSQFKRTAVPNGPKTSSGGSLSPRGDWRMPSDASADAWLRELDSALSPPLSG